MTELRGDLVVLRPVRFDDAARLREIHAEPAVTAWWGSMDDDFPFDEPESTRFTIWVDDADATAGVATVRVWNSLISTNGGNGVRAGNVGGGGSGVEIGQNLIDNNTGNGVLIGTGGVVETFGNNTIRGNGTDGCAGCSTVGPGN